jgi:multidrug efflux pump subunit AcrA (membrane-fusion protein)
MNAHRRLLPALWVLTGAAAGLALIAFGVVSRQAPARVETGARVPTLAVIEVQPVALRVEARGHGIARPADTWQAVANVAGRVVHRHPGLTSGRLLRAGTLLLELDGSRYRLAIAEAEAELASLAAEQAQLEAEADNIGRLLDLERERQALAEQELARIERLAETGAVSQTESDEQRRATLAQQQAVQTLDNQLRLVPARAQRLAAQVERTQTRLAQARQDLADTRFVAPYDLRVSEVAVALHQQVGIGQRLFEADGIDAAEVEAQVPLPMLRRLMALVRHPQGTEAALDIGERLDLSAIEAEVALVGAEDVRWPGRVDRVASGLEPRTRAARVVVVVDEPYRNARPPERPILQRDMYLRVRLSAASPELALVIPAAAVHQGEVFTVDAEDRLARRRVALAFEQGDLAVIRSGLAAGDRVIVDDPNPAVAGLRVEPRRDQALEREIARTAAGEGR